GEEEAGGHAAGIGRQLLVHRLLHVDEHVDRAQPLDELRLGLVQHDHRAADVPRRPQLHDPLDEGEGLLLHRLDGVERRALLRIGVVGHGEQLVHRSGRVGVLLGQLVDEVGLLPELAGGRGHDDVPDGDRAVVHAAPEVDRVALLDRVEVVDGGQVGLDGVDPDHADGGEAHHAEDDDEEAEREPSADGQVREHSDLRTGWGEHRRSPDSLLGGSFERLHRTLVSEPSPVAAGTSGAPGVPAVPAAQRERRNSATPSSSLVCVTSVATASTSGWACAIATARPPAARTHSKAAMSLGMSPKTTMSAASTPWRAATLARPVALVIPSAEISASASDDELVTVARSATTSSTIATNRSPSASSWRASSLATGAVTSSW